MAAELAQAIEFMKQQQQGASSVYASYYQNQAYSGLSEEDKKLQAGVPVGGSIDNPIFSHKNSDAYYAAMASANQRAYNTLQRRQPRDPKATIDATDVLIHQTQMAQLERLGIGATRASTFVASPELAGSGAT